MSKSFIQTVQRDLAARGYDVGTVDGVAGPRTEAAWRAMLASVPLANATIPAASTEPPTQWDARSERNLIGVHPDLVRVMDLARAQSPVPFTVIEGLRTVERQKQLVASGASQTMNSRHITGHAVDIVPHDPSGRLAFDWPLYHRIAPAVKAAAASLKVPLVWGGDWRFMDGPHFELSRSAYPA